ncbi:hypothetical protein NGM10_02035 [Halorussus salilacus]|uniref:hypothetical protein n=1 Tax=Halorussus salilacus TaxID=2953750 RepID=UPI00209C740C|nr:hypothetical protein [Halorussus salilacus]USZ68531.1 hypothetical protein NGM10_02035 [Halorussus salilacus]
MTIGVLLIGVLAVLCGVLVVGLVEPLGLLLIQLGLLTIGGVLVRLLGLAVVGLLTALIGSEGQQSHSPDDSRPSRTQPRRTDLDMDLDTGSIEDYRR